MFLRNALREMNFVIRLCICDLFCVVLFSPTKMKQLKKSHNLLSGCKTFYSPQQLEFSKTNPRSWVKLSVDGLRWWTERFTKCSTELNREPSEPFAERTVPASVLLPGRPTWRPQSLTPPRRWRWGSGPWCWLECPWRTRRRLKPASLAHWDPCVSFSLAFWVSLRCRLLRAVSLPVKKHQRNKYL